MTQRVLRPLVCIALLCGAVAPSALAPRVARAAPSSKPAAPADGPRLVDVGANETYAHAASGFAFAANVGAFRRAKVFALDADGRSVAVGYADPSLKIILTAYVYPHLGVPPDAHFGQVKRDVVRAKARAKLLTDGPVTVEQDGRSHGGLRASYGFVGPLNGVEQDLVSDAYLFAHGPNFVKFRLTYPAADAKAAGPRVELFLKTLAFPPPAAAATRPAK